jgi:hypothetical protein
MSIILDLVVPRASAFFFGLPRFGQMIRPGAFSAMDTKLHQFIIKLNVFL